MPDSNVTPITHRAHALKYCMHQLNAVVHGMIEDKLKEINDDICAHNSYVNNSYLDSYVVTNKILGDASGNSIINVLPSGLINVTRA